MDGWMGLLDIPLEARFLDTEAWIRHLQHAVFVLSSSRSPHRDSAVRGR